ncbi:hypothetical protein [Cedecea colo]|uniref:hypothetical protein n=1 Tax=Cedecea colo TaxID=2552946 RepID=UPI0014300891|nr:hypothetical protein [Cedecea colo]
MVFPLSNADPHSARNAVDRRFSKSDALLARFEVKDGSQYFIGVEEIASRF